MAEGRENFAYVDRVVLMAAKEIAHKLLMEMGFENCYDLGDYSALTLLEKLALNWGALTFKVGLGRF